MTSLSDTQQVLTGDEPTLLTVGVDDDDRLQGSRWDEVPTIVLQGGPSGIDWSVRMTWQEARALADAINDVVDVADFG